MVRQGVMLRVVVGEVQSPGAPIDKELTKFRTILEPVMVHVDGFGAFLFDRVVGESCAGGVVGLDGRGRLRMTKFFEGGADWDCLSCSHVGRGYFGFGGGAHYVAHDLADDV